MIPADPLGRFLVLCAEPGECHQHSHAAGARLVEVSPTKACGTTQRCAVRDTPPLGVDRAVLGRSLEQLREHNQVRAAAVAELVRELGLRSKEAALLNAHKALQEARERGLVTIVDGTPRADARERSPSARSVS